jgi:hypothetical protein
VASLEHLMRLLRGLLEAPAKPSSRPAALEALAACFDRGGCTLREPEARAVLAAEAGLAEEKGRVRISGEAMRHLLVSLERALKGEASPLSFRELIVEGTLDLNDLTFDRRLRFEDCEFRGRIDARMMGCRTLALERCVLLCGIDGRVMSLRGHLFLRRSRSEGPVILRDCGAEGVIDCSGTAFNFTPPPGRAEAPGGMTWQAHQGEALGASRVRARALFWKKVSFGGSGRMTLIDADVTSLRDDMAENQLASWPPAGALSMCGFTYVRKNSAPIGTHLAWLALEPSYFEANGRVLVASLEAASALDDAAKLKIAIRRHANRSEPSLVRRWARGFYLWLQGLAFRPGVVLAMLGVLLAGTGLAAALMQRYDLIEPVDGSLIANACYFQVASPCPGWQAVAGHDYALPRALPPFNGFSYALDLIFPYRPGGFTLLWGGANVGISLLLLILRVIGLALQASLVWSLFGNRDNA